MGRDYAKNRAPWPRSPRSATARFPAPTSSGRARDRLDVGRHVCFDNGNVDAEFFRDAP